MLQHGLRCACRCGGSYILDPAVGVALPGMVVVEAGVVMLDQRECCVSDAIFERGANGRFTLQITVRLRLIQYAHTHARASDGAQGVVGLNHRYLSCDMARCRVCAAPIFFLCTACQECHETLD